MDVVVASNPVLKGRTTEIRNLLLMILLRDNKVCIMQKMMFHEIHCHLTQFQSINFLLFLQYDDIGGVYFLTCLRSQEGDQLWYAGIPATAQLNDATAFCIFDEGSINYTQQQVGGGRGFRPGTYNPTRVYSPWVCRYGYVIFFRSCCHYHFKDRVISH